MSGVQKYSRQREAIYNALMATREHPSAESVYEALRPSFPNLSLATVYRNLALFKSDGRVKSVACVNGIERYDADMREHSHFICTECGRVYDIEEGSVSRAALDQVASAMNASVSTVSVYGVCSGCLDHTHKG